MNDAIPILRLSTAAVQPDPIMLRVQRVLKGTATYDDRFVPDHEELLKMVQILRSMGCSIGYTEGVWDLFHVGHSDYIQKGKEATIHCCPDAEHVIMIIGVDSDALTKQRKGPTRPIESEDRRYRVIAALRSADIVTLLREPEVFNRRLHPEVRVISESTGDNPDHDDMRRYCGELVCLPPQSPTGTTATIRKLVLEGGLEMVDEIAREIGEMGDRLKVRAAEMRREREL